MIGLGGKTYIEVDPLPVNLPEQAVYSRLGRNRHLSSISLAQSVQCKSRMIQALTAVQPRGRWTVLEITGRSENKIVLEGHWHLESAKFAAFAGNAEHLWLGGVTIGPGISELIAAAGDDMTSAVIYDAVGSECADDAIEALQKLAARELARQGMVLDKMRFSPGYGNLSLSNQKKIFEYLELHELGMSLTETFIMQPEKSVTAFAAVIR